MCALIDFYRRNGFAFISEDEPGQDSLIPHDLTHVITGYGATAEAEPKPCLGNRVAMTEEGAVVAHGGSPASVPRGEAARAARLRRLR